MGAPAFAGNTKHAYVVATAAPAAFPVVIDATHVSFQFNAVAYAIPLGSYATLQALADAINASTGGSGATLFSNVLYIDISRSSPTKLRATAIAAGALTQVFAAGSTNDALAAALVGFAAAQALTGGEPLD